MDGVCNTNKVHELNEFVKSCITQAFLQLLETKPFHKISITEIAEKAGVARVSFYRNFDSKEDVLIKHIEKIFFDVDFTKYTFDTKEQLCRLHKRSFSAALRHRSFFKALNDNNLLYLIYNSFKFYAPIHITDTGNYKNEIQPPYYAGATYGVISYWIENDFQIPVDILSEKLTDIIYMNYR